MHLFWQPVLEPLLSLLRPSHVIQIGCDGGSTTRPLARWCRLNRARLDLVDPAPATDLTALAARGGSAAQAHMMPSLDALPLLPAADLVLIDGDNSYHTLFHELQLLWRKAEAEGRPDPVLVCQDTAWPFARRDGYDTPERISVEFRQPVRHGSPLPNEAGLAQAGLHHTERVGSPRNGVRSALEDAIAAHPRPMRVVWLPVLHGLAVVVPAARLAETQALEAFLDDLTLPRPWRALVRLLEQQRLAGTFRQPSLPELTETRPVAGMTRSALSSLPQAVLRAVQTGTFRYDYRGRRMLLNPFDMANYLALLGTLRPRSVFEIGMHDGGRTLWLADMLQAQGVEAQVVGVDLVLPQGLDDPRLTLLQGNAKELGAVLTPTLLENLPRPFLVIEDSAHDASTSAAVLDFFDPWLRTGERIVIEDGIAAQLALGETVGPAPRGSALAAAEFLERRGTDYALDTESCDRFGFNATFNVNGWLVRT